MGRAWSERIFHWTSKASLSNYKNYRVYIPLTRRERTTDTIEFFPEHVQIPKTSLEYWLASATKNLIAILKKPYLPIPFLHQKQKPTMTFENYRKYIHILTTEWGIYKGDRTCICKGDSSSYKSEITNNRWRWNRNNNNEEIQEHSTIRKSNSLLQRWKAIFYSVPKWRQ